MSISMKEQVRKAAELLDKDIPGWFRKVKRNSLDMSNASDCVIGQIYGGWDKNKWDRIDAFGGNLCICISCGCDNKKAFEELNSLWKHEIKIRRD